MIRVTVADSEGQTMTASNIETDLADEWDLTGIAGLWDGASVDGDEVNRPWSHGAFYRQKFSGGRSGSIAIRVRRDSLAGIRDAARIVSGVLADGVLGTLTVDMDGLVTTIGVQRKGSPKIAGGPGGGTPGPLALDAEFDWYAADPRWYGEPRTSYMTSQAVSGALPYPATYPTDYGATGLDGNTTDLTNAGNSDAYPVFVVHGTYPAGFLLACSDGSAIQYDGPVLASAPLTLDALTERASSGGVDRSQFLSVRGFRPIPPGGSLRYSFLPDTAASGWCEATIRDTYM